MCLCLLFMAAQPKKKRTDLEKERAKKIQKIKETNKVLEETKEKKNATLSQLNVLNQTIKEQETVLQTIFTEVELLEQDIEEQSRLINRLETDLVSLKSEYAQLVYQDWKFRDGFDKLLYLLSSDNFSQLIRRQSYFKHYEIARVAQMKEITSVAEEAKTYRAYLDSNRYLKQQLIQVKTIETENLTSIKNHQQVVLKKLNSKEVQLQNDLEQNKQAVKQLEKTIKDLIAQERKKAIEEAKKSSTTTKTPNSTNKSVPLSTEDQTKLSGSFESNMGKLPWPVATGRVSQHFGRQAHPVLKGVYVDNLGIDILTAAHEQVKAVFAGKVVTVTEVPGMHTIVMIQHGQYFTVYAKLKTASVQIGQQVLAKQVIGTAYTDLNGETEVQFQIWNNENKLNPEVWLRSK